MKLVEKISRSLIHPLLAKAKNISDQNALMKLFSFDISLEYADSDSSEESTYLKTIFKD